MGIWALASGALEQGDIVSSCSIPRLSETFDQDEIAAVSLESHRIIVVSQSCDLEKLPAGSNVLVMPVWGMSLYRKSFPNADLKQAAKGLVRHLYVFPETIPGDDELSCVNFRMLAGLPSNYVRGLARRQNGPRLLPPEREVFSNAVGQFISKPASAVPPPSI